MGTGERTETIIDTRVEGRKSLGTYKVVIRGVRSENARRRTTPT